MIWYSEQFAGCYCYFLWEILHCASNCVVIYFKTHWNENCAVCSIISARYSISALTNKIQREDFLEGPERSKSVYYGLVVAVCSSSCPQFLSRSQSCIVPWPHHNIRISVFDSVIAFLNPEKIYSTIIKSFCAPNHKKNLLK